MSEESIVGIGLAVVTAFSVVIWALLQRKDSQQEKQIAKLWEKHDEDVKRLQDLELKIASSHYVKEELDKKFDKLDETFRTGLSELGNKFDRFGEVVVQSLAKK